MAKISCFGALAVFLLICPVMGQDMAGRRTTPTERLYASIDEGRLTMVRSLISRLVPNCPAAAQPSDISAYQRYRARIGADPVGYDAAVQAVETWKMYHCIATYYDGHRYYMPRGMGPGDPDLAYPEPVEALGKFFRAAMAGGLIKFPTEQEEDYFFRRYTAPTFSSSWDESRAIAWFRRPPWQS